MARLIAALTVSLAALTVLAVALAQVLPGGQRISFEESNGTNIDIYALDLSRDLAVNLTHSPAADFGAAWSPDGTRMAFISARGGWYQLYLLTIGGDVRRLDDQLLLPSYGPVWSPDGKSLIYEVDQRVSTVLYLVDVDAPLIAGLNPHVLDDSATNNRFPAWSPDGSEIAFVSWRTGDAEIFAIRRDGTGLTDLTNNPGWDVSPSWSPDGKSIAFYALRDRFRELYVMDRAGGSVRQLTDARDRNNGNYWRAPSWSPDGRFIAYQTFIEGTAELAIIDVASGVSRRLTDDRMVDSFPLWLADGQHLIYMAGGGAVGTLYSVDANGANLHALTPEDSSSKFPALWN